MSLNHPDRFNLTIETYANTLASEQGALSNISSDRDDFLLPNGTIGSTDSSYPRRIRVSIPNSNRIVEVQYPTQRLIAVMNMDAQRLRLISEPKP